MLHKFLSAAGAILLGLTCPPAAQAVAVISTASAAAPEQESLAKPVSGEPAKRVPVKDAVPEWEVVALLLAGFGLVAIIARHRKRLTKIA